MRLQYFLCKVNKTITGNTKVAYETKYRDKVIINLTI